MADTIAVSIPLPKRISKITPLIDAAVVGAAQDTDSNETVYDLWSVGKQSGLAIKLSLFTRNGQGTTPTAPGSSKHILAKYAFSNRRTDAVSDGPTVLTGAATAVDTTLANSAAATAAGQQEKFSDFILVQGRYLHVWLNNDALATNAQVACTLILAQFDF